MITAAFDLAPNQTMRAVTDVVAEFQMPGANIEGFGRKALSIALAGIYDLRQHRDEVLNPVLRQWDVFDRSGLDAEGEKARAELTAYIRILPAPQRGSRRSERHAGYAKRQAVAIRARVRAGRTRSRPDGDVSCRTHSGQKIQCFRFCSITLMGVRAHKGVGVAV